MKFKHFYLFLLLVFVISFLIFFVYLFEKKNDIPPYNFITEKENVNESLHTFLDLNSCWRVPLEKEDRRKNKKKFRLISIDTNRMFLNGGSGIIQCPGIGCQWKTKKDSLKHLKEIAFFIKKIDPDFVHLSGIEGCSALRLLFKEIGSDYGLKPYMISGEDKITGQNVGFLTKIDPVSDLKRNEKKSFYLDRTELYCSGLSRNYMIRLNIGKQDLFIIGVQMDHDPISKEKKQTQIEILMNSIEKRKKEELVCVLGELSEIKKDFLNLFNLFQIPPEYKNERGKILFNKKIKEKVIVLPCLFECEEYLKKKIFNRIPIIVELVL